MSIRFAYVDALRRGTAALVTEPFHYTGIEDTRTLRLTDALFLGVALGLALLTKATAYLFIPWPLAAIYITSPNRSRPLALGALVALAVSVTINVPQYIRMVQAASVPVPSQFLLLRSSGFACHL